MNRYTDTFVCISNSIYEHYSYLDNRKKRVIYNGVEKSHYSPKEYIIGEKIRFLISGRIEKAKGQDIVIEACKELIRRRITNFTVYLAGKGNMNIPESLSSYVYLLGQVSDMPALRKKCNIELVCSLAEAFGRSTVEAMLSGNPVIGSESGGTKELIKDGEDGLLFKPGDYMDLANKMEFFIKNSNAIEYFGLSAQKKRMIYI